MNTIMYNCTRTCTCMNTEIKSCYVGRFFLFLSVRRKIASHFRRATVSESYFRILNSASKMFSLSSRQWRGNTGRWCLCPALLFLSGLCQTIVFKKNFVVPQVSQKLLLVQGTTTTASTTDSSGAQNLDSLETHATVVGGDVPQAQLETSSNMDSTD